MIFYGIFFTTPELEQKLGEAVKNLRLQKNLTREVVCERADISITALRNLESGKGASIRTLIRVARTLGRQDWILALAPQVVLIHFIWSETSLLDREPVAERGKPRESS